MSDRDDIVPPGDIAPGDTGPEHQHNLPEKSQVSPKGAAKSDAACASPVPGGSDFDRLVSALAHLPDSIRRRVFDLIDDKH